MRSRDGVAKSCRPRGLLSDEACMCQPSRLLHRRQNMRRSRARRSGCMGRPGSMVSGAAAPMSFLSACHPFTWPMVGADPKPFAPILTFAIEQLVLLKVRSDLQQLHGHSAVMMRLSEGSLKWAPAWPQLGPDPCRACQLLRALLRGSMNICDAVFCKLGPSTTSTAAPDRMCNLMLQLDP